MATYKCDIKKQFGKYSGTIWKASERPGQPLFTDETTPAGAADRVVDGISKAGFGEGDEVIFRDSSYGSLKELRGVLVRSPY